MLRIYDISPVIQSELAVFPGDTAFTRNVAMDFRQGDHLSLSSITSTLHIGAHADAPSHYHQEGRSIDQVDLTTYLGPCQVIDVSNRVASLTVKKQSSSPMSSQRAFENPLHCSTSSPANSSTDSPTDSPIHNPTHSPFAITLEKLLPIDIVASRVLFKTNSIQDVCAWQDDFCFLSPEVIGWLAQKKVRLIGIDTPSMDHSQSKSLDGHQEFYRHNIAILEGLVLTDVPQGFYNLVALPLKIAAGEASPVRAILYSGELS